MKTRKLLVPLTLFLAAACGGGGTKDSAVAEEGGDESPDMPKEEGEGPGAENKPKVATQDAAKKHVEERDAAWTAKDGKKVAATYTADAVIAMPGANGMEESKPAEMEKRMAMYASAFPDLKHTTIRGVVDGDVAVIQWVVTGTNSGEFMGEKPTNKKIGYAGASVLWFSDDGKVKRENAYFDMSTMMGQLGKLPKNQKVRPALTAPTGTFELLVAKPGDEKHETTLKDFYAAMHTATPDYKVIGEKFVTEDVIVGNVYMPADTKGRKAVEKEIKDGNKAFVDQKMQVSGCYAAGDFAACEHVWTATWKNPSMGMPATGKTGTVHGVEVVRFKDGKIAETWGYGSGLEFAATFGLMKDKPGATPKGEAKGQQPAGTPGKGGEPPKAEAKGQPKGEAKGQTPAGSTQPAKAPGAKPDQPPAVKK